MTAVYLSLGSNIGNRAENLCAAIAALQEAGVHITRVSKIYETEPVDYLNQPWFLNCVVQAKTDLTPIDLLHQLRGIESAMGSSKAFSKGPRLIDLDILYFGTEVIATEALQVPHPRMAQRKFVLAPLAEIAPILRHPITNQTSEELLHSTVDPSQIRLAEINR